MLWNVTLHVDRNFRQHASILRAIYIVVDDLASSYSSDSCLARRQRFTLMLSCINGGLTDRSCTRTRARLALLCRQVAGVLAPAS